MRQANVLIKALSVAYNFVAGKDSVTVRRDTSLILHIVRRLS